MVIIGSGSAVQSGFCAAVKLKIMGRAGCGICGGVAGGISTEVAGLTMRFSASASSETLFGGEMGQSSVLGRCGESVRAGSRGTGSHWGVGGDGERIGVCGGRGLGSRSLWEGDAGGGGTDGK